MPGIAGWWLGDDAWTCREWDWRLTGGGCACRVARSEARGQPEGVQDRGVGPAAREGGGRGRGAAADGGDGHDQGSGGSGRRRWGACAGSVRERPTHRSCTGRRAASRPTHRSCTGRRAAWRPTHRSCTGTLARFGACGGRSRAGGDPVGGRSGSCGGQGEAAGVRQRRCARVGRHRLRPRRFQAREGRPRERPRTPLSRLSTPGPVHLRQEPHGWVGSAFRFNTSGDFVWSGR
jgi:hypothetical protein